MVKIFWQFQFPSVQHLQLNKYCKCKYTTLTDILRRTHVEYLILGHFLSLVVVPQEIRWMLKETGLMMIGTMKRMGQRLLSGWIQTSPPGKRVPGPHREGTQLIFAFRKTWPVLHKSRPCRPHQLSPERDNSIPIKGRLYILTTTYRV